MPDLPSSLRELLAYAQKRGLHGRYQSKQVDKLWLGRVVIDGVSYDGRGSDRRAALNRAAEKAMEELEKAGRSHTSETDPHRRPY